jgi:hypothetical protein
MISDTRLSLSLTALPSSVLLSCRFLTVRGEIRPLQYILTTPIMQRRIAYTPWVWALPVSLAATPEISC